MKRLLALLAAVFLLEAIFSAAQPFGAPLYIADPASMECRYYFSGDQRHFNPRPENYTVNIGRTSDFRSESQACDFFRCTYTNGSVKVDESKKPVEKDLCLCPGNAYWDDMLGCVKFNKPEERISFLQLILRWISGILSLK